MRIEIPERRGAELLAKINDRDEYAKNAQLVLNAKNETIEAMIVGQLQAAGQDPDAPRGSVRCQREPDGKYTLTIGAAQPAPGGMPGQPLGQPGPQPPALPNGAAS